jgi:hypothetical protein
MKKRHLAYWLIFLFCCYPVYGLHGQGRTFIEFYNEVPAVSDFVIEIKPQMSNNVVVQADGWRIPPGQQVKIELPYVPPNSIVSEVRLGFIWDGQVVSGTFEGWVLDRLRYRVFEETIYPHENQKRIYPSMQARGYEFKIKCNITLRPEQPSLILQSLAIYWDSVIEK